MEARVFNSDVILMHGPSFVGKGIFYTSRLSQTHHVLEPTKIFQENSSLGLRDVGLQAYRHLKEGHRVVVLDSNESKNTRKSYINLLQKKCSKLSIATVNLVPKFGCRQLFWSRELRFAETSLCAGEAGTSYSCDDRQILKWFENETDLDITYRHGIVDAPTTAEGGMVHRQVEDIYTRSKYKFEVPALFIQWEFLQTYLVDESKQLTTKVMKLIRCWSDINPCGRIIIISDGSQIRTGEYSKSQQVAELCSALTQLTKAFSDSPMYVMHIDDPKKAGGFVIPPKPGILAYLQRRHCLNLHTRSTVYLYESSSHMKMAENAGVRHLKASRVLEHPSLVISSHAAVTPAIPDMLRHIQFITDVGPSDSDPSLPLFNIRDTFTSGHVHHSLGHGRSEYLFAATWDVVERYQDLYCTLASRVGEAGSKMSPNKVNQSNLSKLETSQNNVFVSSHSRSNISDTHSSRDLPKWMLGRDRSNSSRSSLDSARSNSTASSDVRVRKTMYVMSEKELVEIATEILRQAGKMDVIDMFKSRQRKEDEIRQKQNKPSNICKSSVKKRRLKEISNTGSKSSNKIKTVYPKKEPNNSDEKVVKKLHFQQSYNKSNQMKSYKGARLKSDRDVKLEIESDLTDSDRSMEISENDGPQTLDMDSDTEDETDDKSVHTGRNEDEETRVNLKTKHNAKTKNNIKQELKVKQLCEGDTEMEQEGEQLMKDRAVIRDANVKSVLDDFVTSHVVRKNSPRKRTREGNKDENTGTSPVKQRHVSTFLDKMLTSNTNSGRAGSCVENDREPDNMKQKSPSKKHEKEYLLCETTRSGHRRKNSAEYPNITAIKNTDRQPQNTHVKTGIKEESRKKRQTPDLSILDDIFS